MDFFIDNTMKQAILELTNKDIATSRPTWNYWKNTTERMLRFMSVGQIVDMVLNIANGLSDEEWNKGYPTEIFGEEITKENSKIVRKYYKNNADIDIVSLAEKMGLKVRANKCICPFHEDTDASLVFYPQTNSFYCFGKCRTGGDVLTFYRKMKEVQDGTTARK